jgi:hypothetical protein
MEETMLKYALPGLALVAAATPACAGVAYLSRTGSGTACTLAAPCAGMGPAVLTAAGVGGEIICLDRGPYGGTTISQSVTISCGDGLWEAPGFGVTVSTPAGSNVVIEGLVQDGITHSGTSISFAGQGNLVLHRVRIGNISDASSHGVSFTPSGAATLQISNSTFYTIGGSAVFVRPTGSGSSKITINGVAATGNSNGLTVDSTAVSAPIHVSVRDSVLSNNSGSGILTIASASSEIRLVMDGVKVTTNGIGINSNGSLSHVIVGRSTIAVNQVGLATASGGAIYSYGTNQINGNNNDNVNVSTLISQN